MVNLAGIQVTAMQKAAIPIKRTKPRHRNVLQRGLLMRQTAEKPDFKRFSGIEKVHHNSIKITVDFWQRMRDSNPRKRSQSPVCYRYTNPLYVTRGHMVETTGLEPVTSCV